jgi:iron complex transport system ATP-binding protein
MILINNLSHNKNQRTILNKINLKLDRGSIYGLIGPNGAGKTSLIKQICGIIPVQEGKILVNNQNVSSFDSLKRSQYVAYMPQLHRINFNFTVQEIILMGSYPYSRTFSPLIDQILKETDLESKKNLSILALSGGEQQKVYLARALAQNTPFLVMDEPFTFLDVKQQTNIVSVIKRYRDKGHTFLISLHDLTLAKTLCDSIIMLKQGKIFLQGPTSKILEPNLIESLYE